MQTGDSLLRVDGVESEAGLEDLRDALDELGVEYEHARSEPEDSYPQTVYFNVSFASEGEVERLVGRLGERSGYDAEVI